MCPLTAGLAAQLLKHGGSVYRWDRGVGLRRVTNVCGSCGLAVRGARDWYMGYFIPYPRLDGAAISILRSLGSAEPSSLSLQCENPHVCNEAESARGAE
jgi:hypothetical protein